MNQTFAVSSFGEFAYEVMGEGEQSCLFLHGGASNLRAWDGVIPVVSNMVRCYAIDLPGHGKTEIAPLGFDALAQATIEVCGNLKLEKPFVIGHSFGGLAAAYLGQYFPNLFAGVMAIDPYLSNREIRRRFASVEEAKAAVLSMDWPWRETDDLETEVERCLAGYSARPDQDALRRMIAWGYRLQPNGVYQRFPRQEDEMKGVAENWSIDVGATFSAVGCPLAIVTSTDPAWNLQKRKENLVEISIHVANFESLEIDCNHDVPGYEPKKLADIIGTWLAAVNHAQA